DWTLSVPPAGVLANDVSPNGPALSAALVSDVSHGTLTLAANGSFLYKPAPPFVGQDTFPYHATRRTHTPRPATRALTGAGPAPAAAGDSYRVLHDRTLTVDAAAANAVLTNDTDADKDALTAVLATQPQHGSVTLGADGTLTYSPFLNYVGTDSFQYQASDGV